MNLDRPMRARGAVLIGIGMAIMVCALALLVAVSNNRRVETAEERLVDRAAQVVRDEVDTATARGGIIDDAVDDRVEALGITTTTTTIYGPYAPPTSSPTTTTTTTTSTTQPLLPAVTTTTVTIPITLPTVPITLPEPLP